jgi:virulence-associated protein VapD
VIEGLVHRAKTTFPIDYDKLLFRIVRGTSDANISLDDLRQLLIRLGFEERTRGSHHCFRKEGIEEKINLQRDDNKAKVYQVRQIRAVILKHKLGGQL